jgi:hypothetical protein
MHASRASDLNSAQTASHRVRQSMSYGSRCFRPGRLGLSILKVSLAYQEELFCTVAHTRFSAVRIGGCDGPDFVIGGNHTWFSSVRSVEAAKPSNEVVVPKAASLVGAGVSLDRLDRLLHKHHCQQFCCGFVASAGPFSRCCLPSRSCYCWFCSGEPNQITHLPVGTLVPLPTLWHSNGAGISFPQRSRKAEEQSRE